MTTYSGKEERMCTRYSISRMLSSQVYSLFPKKKEMTVSGLYVLVGRLSSPTELYAVNIKTKLPIM